jgi:hypothetical protein
VGAGHAQGALGVYGRGRVVGRLLLGRPFRLSDAVHQLHQRQARLEQVGQFRVGGQQGMPVRRRSREQALQILVGQHFDLALALGEGIGFGLAGLFVRLRLTHDLALRHWRHGPRAQW